MSSFFPPSLEGVFGITLKKNHLYGVFLDLDFLLKKLLLCRIFGFRLLKKKRPHPDSAFEKKYVLQVDFEEKITKKCSSRMGS